MLLNICRKNVKKCQICRYHNFFSSSRCTKSRFRPRLSPIYPTGEAYDAPPLGTGTGEGASRFLDPSNQSSWPRLCVRRAVRSLIENLLLNVREKKVENWSTYLRKSWSCLVFSGLPCTCSSSHYAAVCLSVRWAACPLTWTRKSSRPTSYHKIYERSSRKPIVNNIDTSSLRCLRYAEMISLNIAAATQWCLNDHILLSLSSPSTPEPSQCWNRQA